MVWSLPWGMIDMSVLLCSQFKPLSSMLVLLAPFHELGVLCVAPAFWFFQMQQEPNPQFALLSVCLFLPWQTFMVLYLSWKWMNAEHLLFAVLECRVHTVYVFILALCCVCVNRKFYQGKFVSYFFPPSFRCLNKWAAQVPWILPKTNLTPLKWIMIYMESCFPHRRPLIRSWRRRRKML